MSAILTGKRVVTRQGPLDFSTINKWRAVIHDTVEGVVVVDVEASTEADARGTAARVGKEHLNCHRINTVIAMRHSDMPEAWLRYQTRQFNHIKVPKKKKRK